jgi:4-hydroxy-tetrahydrodipicolinate synthase
MNVLGMDAGPLRPPLGKMTKQGIEMVVEKTRNVYEKNPALFEAIEEFFDVDVAERLSNEKYREGLYYDSY